MMENINSQNSGNNEAPKHRRRYNPDNTSSPSMKAMICEMCGSNEIVKSDGLYQCVHCKTKYTVEEARNLFLNGTVKIDSSEKVSNLYEIARRARDENNIDNAAKYYDLILQEDANSWEAQFYTVYFTSLQCKIGEIGYAANSMSNSAKSVVSLIKKLPSSELQSSAVQEVIARVLIIVSSLISAAKKHYQEFSSVSGTSNEFNDRFLACVLCLSEWGLCIDESFEDNYDIARLSTILMKRAINQLVENFKEYSARFVNAPIDISPVAETYNEFISVFALKVKKYDANYIPPRVTAPKSTPKSTSNGCYIATAVYGSYDCPEVWTLRRFRDFALAKTWYGRAFIRAYYAISPRLVKWFGNSVWFKKMCKPFLDGMTNKLTLNGFENTPYIDKNW